VETRGHPSEEAFNGAHEAGYSDEQIMVMISNVALTTFSNYMNETLETEVDIPAVEPVQAG